MPALFGDSLKKAARLVRLQNLLCHNERGLGTHELAAACAVSARTIQRDLLALCEAGGVVAGARECRVCIHL